MYIASRISDGASGHPHVDVVVTYPTRRDLVQRGAIYDLVAAKDAERRKKADSRANRTNFVQVLHTYCPYETYCALSARWGLFLVECASLASLQV